MAYNLTDEQREILGREMRSDRIDAWVAGVLEGQDEAALEAKIAIIAASRSPHPYDEMRRRGYPDIGDQLDALYHAGIFPEDMAAQLKAVKDANPKPE
jgi:hypothetical protein|tara:strand:- start:31 stop:324 length:294 start_codon:yes stop_codon:yes gene_type:complete